MSGDSCVHGKDPNREVCVACLDPDPGLTYPRDAVRQAYRNGETAGYAAAVADVVAMHKAKRNHAHDAAREARAVGNDLDADDWEDVRVWHESQIKELTNGAHVGAAKKGGGT